MWDVLFDIAAAAVVGMFAGAAAGLVVYTVISITIDVIREKLKKIKKKKSMDKLAGEIVEMKKDGNVNYVDIGLRGTNETIRIEGENISSDIREGMVISV